MRNNSEYKKYIDDTNIESRIQEVYYKLNGIERPEPQESTVYIEDHVKANIIKRLKEYSLIYQYCQMLLDELTGDNRYTPNTQHITGLPSGKGRHKDISDILIKYTNKKEAYTAMHELYMTAFRYIDNLDVSGEAIDEMLNYIRGTVTDDDIEYYLTEIYKLGNDIDRILPSLISENARHWD
ncbi:hypothetical protein [Veillonella caviae]|uniref:hypothetical protein n=1 Tax=Veillonella caviae TaxID=248316 RepID=UPI0023A8C003|nr:hypothetical protein [Veillonella caviae]MCI5708955.1 hypothetical protein [Veillonella caviae]MCI6407666.1 hypothetical protein [Veillonella caviae]MDY5714968.1 hypothetical protein [Veillonella caviae]MDY6225802.1 hypothetical protein [Veillonella caviae]